MKLSARKGLECRILHHLSQTGKLAPLLCAADGCINLSATFQFSPATSKSIDIPALLTNQSKSLLELSIFKSMAFVKDAKGISFKNRLKGHINW
jgi:hypothetical protein